MKRFPSNGFTLIEILIVSAVIAVLVGIGVVRFGTLIRKSHEGQTMSNLGSLRSTLNIYFSDNFYYPQGVAGEDRTTLVDALVSKYIKAIPKAHAYPYHPETREVDNVDDDDFEAADATGDGNWVYIANAGHSEFGRIHVECYEFDSKGIPWSAK